MSSAQKSDPVLWEKVVAEVKAGSKSGPAGTWNARKAQLAVSVYKQRGGTYVGKKSRDNSLAQWTREDWGYVNDKPGNRYLPMKVREELTPAEVRTENIRKKSATRNGKQRASYSSSVAAKLRKDRKSRKSGKSRRKSRKSGKSRRKSRKSRR
jgi:hypothetical protein